MARDNYIQSVLDAAKVDLTHKIGIETRSKSLAHLNFRLNQR